MRRRAGILALAALSIASASLATAATVQQGNLRITVLTQVEPEKLPRDKPAPIAVFVSAHLATPTGELPPQLQAMRIDVNKHGLLQSKGLPTCPLPKLAAASSYIALRECSNALIGSGQFWAHIVLADQGAYPTRGRLLIFNGEENGKPVLLAHIFTSNPFDSAFTIVFSIKHVNKGRYGTELYASFPESLGSWGYVDRIKLTLKRKYEFQGRKLSYFNASCPALKGTERASFSLSYATLYFDTTRLSANVIKSCGVRE